MDEEFYLLATKDYDRDIDILRTSQATSHAWFERNIEPRIFKVLDSVVEGDQVKCLSMLDNELYLDSISREQTFENNALETLKHQGYHARSFNWPYYSFASIDHHIIILNAFNVHFVQRYELP